MKKVLMILIMFTLSACVTVNEKGEPEVKADPVEMVESRIALGLGYLENGNMSKARENLEKATQHAPTYYRSQLAMAHYYETVGETEAARKTYQTVLRAHPKNGNILNNYGTFLCKQGEYQKADEYFNRAIAQPYYYLVPASYENAAFCALKSGDKEQARYYFAKTLDHDPNRARSLLQLAKLEIDAQQYTQARIRLMQFNQRYGNQKTSLQLLVELEKKAGNKALEKKYQAALDTFS